MSDQARVRQSHATYGQKENDARAYAKAMQKHQSWGASSTQLDLALEERKEGPSTTLKSQLRMSKNGQARRNMSRNNFYE